MKKTFLIAALVAFLCTVAACSSEPVDDALGNKIIQAVIEEGKKEGVGCTDSLMNEDITKKAIEEVGGSLRGYTTWLESDSGQEALQNTMVKCMTEK